MRVYEIVSEETVVTLSRREVFIVFRYIFTRSLSSYFNMHLLLTLMSIDPPVSARMRSQKLEIIYREG